MTLDQVSPVNGVDVEPTLARVLRSAVRATRPVYLAELFALLVPTAAIFAVFGMVRSAAAVIALGALVVWAVCERRLQLESAGEATSAALHRWLRAGRAGAGVIGAALAAVVLLELFFRLMGSAPIS